MTAVVLAAMAFGLAAALTRLFCRPDAPLRVLDYPNVRSLHRRPVPRTGGLAILAAIYLAGAAAALFGQWVSVLGWLAAGGLLLAVVSFYDDRRGLHFGYRLAVHVAAAGLLLAAGLALEGFALPGRQWSWPAWIGAGASLLFTVWMVNLYNFMDGMDGFAGGMAVCGFGTLALLGAMGGGEIFAAVGLIVAAAAGGFLPSNFPPARIFMGDAGSAPLGFMAAGLSLWGTRDGLFPLWAALLVFSPFIVDASVTLVRRALRGERIWQAHKSHYYQRLVLLGWSQRQTVLAEYALFLACAGSALWAVRQPIVPQWGVLTFWALCYPLLIAAVVLREKRALPSAREVQ
jgi:UDP-N-acetylmuramyl pentapeptide phosphotransferase/UDP-N-acetylglucosamine-1-phosphate transferase